MPSDRIRVRSVVPFQTAQPGLVQFTINAETADGRWTKQYVTVNAWLGSLCQRVKEQQQIADVVWRDSKFGQQLVSVEPVTT
jgi:hypothetical protein